MTGEFDPLRAFQVLEDEGVRFIVIGGLAGELLGAPLATDDIDICCERSPGNMDRLARALERLGAELRAAAAADEEPPVVLDGPTLAAGESFTFTTDAGDLDVVAMPTGTRGFADLNARAVGFDVGGGLTVTVTDLDDLIRMKEARASAKDQAHLHVLSVLREMTDGGQPSP